MARNQVEVVLLGKEKTEVVRGTAEGVRIERENVVVMLTFWNDGSGCEVVVTPSDARCGKSRLTVEGL